MLRSFASERSRGIDISWDPAAEDRTFSAAFSFLGLENRCWSGALPAQSGNSERRAETICN